MIHSDYACWSIVEGKSGLLMFAQSFEELMSPHSHDSHKVPALNFHFICLEIQNVINLIEKNVLDRGNLIPLISEVQSLFAQDPIAKKLFGNDFSAVFSKKNSAGEFDKKPIKSENSKIDDDIISKLKVGINYIIAEMARNNQYYTQLVTEAKKQVINCGEDLLQLDKLYDLARIIASELINLGFSQAYIYNCVKQVFFSTSSGVDSVASLDTFFDCFELKKRKFCVYLPLNSFKQKTAFEDYNAFEFAENIYEMFNPAIPYILKYSCEAKDPYSAREQVLDIANFCLSVNQFIKHNKFDFNPKYSDVVDLSTHEVTFIKKLESPIVREYPNCGEIKKEELLKTCFGLKANVLQVLQLHSAALISKNTDNQLINLWTAIEVVVPIDRKGGLSRINQICNALTAALGRNYFCVLVNQLLSDINAISSEAITKILGIDYEGRNDTKLLAILTLHKYQSIYDEIIDILKDNSPLLACRMNRYKTQWSNTAEVKHAYQAHEKRLSQQIMRIYRTRNMLVHDGTSLPYMEYVLQNLHYYIDTFVRFLNTYHAMGYHSVRSITDAAQFQEQIYLNSLSTNMQLQEDNFLSYILMS